MSLLLDTHALLWWLSGNRAMPVPTRTAIREADLVYVSAVSAIEINTKFRLGKLPEGRTFANGFAEVVEDQGFTPLPIEMEHAALAGSLAISHKDPFDRLLIAQTQAEGLTLVSNEAVFDAFGIARLW